MEFKQSQYFLPVFLLSLNDNAFWMWHKRSISAFEDLYIDKTFASYSQLSLKFKRTKGHLFRYLQIQRKNFKDLLLLPAKTLPNNILEVCFYTKMFYSCLYDLITKRETDLDFKGKTF